MNSRQHHEITEMLSKYEIERVWVSPTGDTLSIRKKDSFAIWDVASKKQIGMFPSWVEQPSYSEDGSRMLITDFQSLYVLALPTGNMLFEVKESFVGRGANISPCGQFLFLRKDKQYVRYHWASDSITHVWQAFPGGGIYVSPDGQWMGLECPERLDTHEVAVFSLEKTQGTTNQMPYPIEDMAFSHSGELILQEEGSILIEETRLVEHSVVTMRVLQQGLRLLTLHRDPTVVKMWDLSTKRVQDERFLSEEFVCGFSATLDGQLLYFVENKKLRMMEPGWNI